MALPDRAHGALPHEYPAAPPDSHGSGFSVWLPWRPGASERPHRRRRRLGLGLWLGLGWIALVVGAALTASWLPLPPYDQTLVGPPKMGPSLDHLLGTDGLGRDMLSRVIFGSRVSLGIAAGAIAMCAVFGGTLGIIAGYFRGRRESVIMAVTDVALAFPALVFALAVVSFVGGGFFNILVIMGVLGIPAWTRITRGTALSFAEREFVLSAKALGWRDRSIILREILPNVAVPVASFAFIAMAVIVVAEGGLAFLGLSVPPPTPTWGGMINAGRSDLDSAAHIALVPSAVMFLTVLACNVVGDRLRELLNVRESGLAVEPPRRRVAAGVAAVAPGVSGSSAIAEADGGEPRRRTGTAPLLEVIDLKTAFITDRGLVPAVDGVSFTLERGRTLAVVGESGSGKTMLVRSILGLADAPNTVRSGHVFYGGRELSGHSPDELRDVLGPEIGAVFQNPMTALNPVRTIGTQLSEPLRVHRRLSKRDALAVSERLLGEVGIPEPRRRLRQYPHQLSGGMLQRTTIAIAMSCDPKILFADEPTTALDVTVQAQILRLLDRERTERDMAMVLVSHDLAVVSEWADEVMVMYAGKVVERGPAEALFTRTRMPYTEALLQSIPDLGNESHTRLRVIDGRPPDPVALPSGCRFHPRCPYAQERCTVEEPPLFEAETPGHAYACWFPVGTSHAEHGVPVGEPHALTDVAGRSSGR